MWWEYVIVFGAILFSTGYLVRYFYKKIKAPACDCKECPLMKNTKSNSFSGKMNCCDGCAFLK